MKSTPTMPLTRRGWFVAGLIVVTFILGVLFGPRSLNAVIAPAFVALLVAWWQVRRVDRPSMERHMPPEGTVGGDIEVSIECATETNRLGRLEDTTSHGLIAEGNNAEFDLDSGHRYTLHLYQRGRHHVGPMTVAVSDIFNLVERTYEYRTVDELLVYPRIHEISSEGLERLAKLAGVRLHRERHEFDRLREYRPEDSLRDIHWKTSAKRPDVDFIVKEFVRETDRGTLLLSGESTPSGDDALADILASISAALLRRGLSVAVETSEGFIEPITSIDDVDRILTELATLGPGSPSQRGDVHVVAESANVVKARIEIGNDHITFGDLLGAEHQMRQERPPVAAQIRTTEVAD